MLDLRGEAECAPPVRASEQPVDCEHLFRMTLGDRALAGEVLRLFERQARALIARMAGAPPDSMKTMAHTLDGSARGIGAWSVSRAAQQVEKAVRDGRDPAAAIDALKSAAGKAMMAIPGLLKGISIEFVFASCRKQEISFRSAGICRCEPIYQAARAVGSLHLSATMPKITYIDASGQSRTIDAETSATLMETAINNDIPGIEAECGGACACATCHVYIDEAWRAKVGEPAAMEQDMLDFAFDVRPNSRLSCQIKISDDLDGLVVVTPERQA